MRPINQCLNTQLAKICQQALELEQLQVKIKACLPDNLKEHIQVGSFNKSCLSLSTTDAVWASQMRYLIPELRDSLRQKGFYNLRSIKVMVIEQQSAESKKKKKRTKPISEAARSIILSESEDCSHEPLKEALKALARNDG